MQYTFQLPLPDDAYINLGELVQSMRASQNRRAISPFCQKLEIMAYRLNQSGTRVLITSDPTPSGGEAYALLPEQSKEFGNTGGINNKNSISILDKWLKLSLEGLAEDITASKDAIVIIDIA